MGDDKTHILMVEDDALVSGLLTVHLKNAGYDVEVAETAEQAVAAMAAKAPSLIISDLGLPDEDGLTLIRKVRSRSSVPIVVLTARTSAENRIAALEMGADDYLTKGVDPEELLLRIRNILARVRNAPDAMPATGPVAGGGGPDAQVVRFSGWTVDLAGYTVKGPDGGVVDFTRSEFLMLAALARKIGRVVSRDSLLDAVSGFDEAPLDRTIDTYISRLRKKIEPNPKKPEIIVTMTGVGYKLNDLSG